MKKKIIAVAIALIVSGCALGTVCGCTDGSDDDKNAHIEHTFTSYVSNGDATCYKNGTKTAKCDGCDATRTIEDKDTLGHVFEDGTCKRCSQTLLNYKLSEDGSYYCVNGLNDAYIFEKEVTVPAEYGGLPVKAVGDGAFRSFWYMESITLPGGLTEIGDYAFTGCRALKQIAFPDSVKKIGFNALGDCGNLQSVTFPASLKEIEGGLLDGCASLKSLHFTKGLEEIHTDAFWDLKSLEEITVDEGNSAYKSVDNCLLTKDGKTMLLGCKNSKIPDGVVEIRSAFHGCVGLKEITLPESLKTLYGFTFYGCKSLESIELPENLEGIGRHTFEGCTDLKEISLPKKLKWIEYRLFADCESLVKLTVDEHNEKFKSEGNCLLSKDGKILYEGTNDSVIPDGVELIENNAFAGRKGLKSLILPESLKEIGNYAFELCEGLTQVVLPESIEKMGAAFAECENLKTTSYGGALYLGSASNPYFALLKAADKTVESYEIHSDTKIICARAFEGCDKVQKIIVPDGVISIGMFAFGGKSLKEISLGNGLKYMDYGIVVGSNLTEFEFRGTEKQWEEIEKDSQWGDGVTVEITFRP